MKQRFTTVELAKLRIPGLPTTPQGWDKRAKNERWPVEILKGRGRGGERHEYSPPPEIMALIEKRLQGDLPPAEPRQVKAQQPSSEVRYAMSGLHLAEPRPRDDSLPREEIELPALLRCHAACVAVYGERFSEVNAREQMAYAVDLYNLFLRFATIRKDGAKRSLSSMDRLDNDALAQQLRLFKQLGFAKHFPSPEMLGAPPRF